MRILVKFLFCLLCASSCSRTSGPSAPTDPQVTGASSTESAVISHDILRREPVANAASVLHVLVSWQEHSKDPSSKGASRSQAQADGLALMIRDKARAGDDFAELMREHSEDPGSASSGKSYDVTPDAGLVLEFKQLSLRLEVGEVGICQTGFGYHIIKRVK